MFRPVPQSALLCRITCSEGRPYVGRHRHTTAHDGSRMNQKSGEESGEGKIAAVGRSSPPFANRRWLRAAHDSQPGSRRTGPKAIAELVLRQRSGLRAPDSAQGESHRYGRDASRPESSVVSFGYYRPEACRRVPVRPRGRCRIFPMHNACCVVA